MRPTTMAIYEQEQLDNLRSVPTSVGNSTTLMGSKNLFWTTRNRQLLSNSQSGSPEGQHKHDLKSMSNTQGTFAIQKLMEQKSAHMTQAQLSSPQPQLHSAALRLYRTSQAKAVHKRHVLADYFRILNNQPAQSSSTHRVKALAAGEQAAVADKVPQEQWVGIRIVKKKATGGKGGKPRQEKLLEVVEAEPQEETVGKEAVWACQQRIAKAREEDDQMKVSMRMKMSRERGGQGGGEVVQRQVQLNEMVEGQETQQTGCLGAVEQLQPGMELDAQPSQHVLANGLAASRKHASRPATGRGGLKSARTNALSARHHIAGDLRNFVHPSQQALAAIGNRTANMKYFLSTHRPKPGQQDRAQVSTGSVALASGQAPKAPQDKQTKASGSCSGRVSARAWQLSQTLRVSQQNLNQQRQPLRSERMALQPSDAKFAHLNQKSQKQPRKRDIDVFLGGPNQLGSQVGADDPYSQQRQIRGSRKAKRSDHALCLQTSAGLREESPGQYLVNPRLANREQATSPSRQDSQKGSECHSPGAGGNAMDNGNFDWVQRQQISAIPPLRNLPSAESRTDAAMLAQLTESRSGGVEEQPYRGTVTLSSRKVQQTQTEAKGKEPRTQRMQVINKQGTATSKNGIFKMIVKSEQGLQDNLSDDNSGNSFTSPIEKLAASVEFNDDAFNSKDNQEILNDIMGLQRFQATLEQEPEKPEKKSMTAKPSSRRQTTQTKGNHMKLKDVTELDEAQEQPSGEVRYHDKATSARQEPWLTIQSEQDQSMQTQAAKTIASLNQQYKQDDAYKCYKIPSISKCLQFKILPKHTKLMQSICAQLATHPMGKEEALSQSKRTSTKRPKTGIRAASQRNVLRLGSVRKSGGVHGLQASVQGALQDGTSMTPFGYNIRNDPMIQSQKKQTKELAMGGIELKQYLAHQQHAAELTPGPHTLLRKQDQLLNTVQGNGQKILSPAPASFSQIPIQNHSLGLDARVEQILVSRQQGSAPQMEAPQHYPADHLEHSASPSPVLKKSTKMSKALRSTEVLPPSGHQPLQSPSLLRLPDGRLQGGRMRKSAEKNMVKELDSDGNTVDVQKFVEESKSQIKELQQQYDTLRGMLQQNIDEQSPNESKRETMGMHDDPHHRVPANEYTSTSEEGGDGVDSFPQKFDVLKMPTKSGRNHKVNQQMSSGREQKLMDRGSNRAYLQLNAIKTVTMPKPELKMMKEWQKDLPASIKHNLVVYGPGRNGSSNHPRSRLVGRVLQNNRSQKLNINRRQGGLTKNPDLVVTRPPYQALPSRHDHDLSSSSMIQQQGKKQVVTMKLDLQRRTEDSMENVKDTVKEHDSHWGGSRRSLRSKDTLGAIREPSAKADGTWRVRTHKARSYLTASNKEFRMNKATVALNVASGEDCHPDSMRGRSLRESGIHNLNFGLKDVVRSGDSDCGSSSLGPGNNQRRGTVYLQGSTNKDKNDQPKANMKELCMNQEIILAPEQALLSFAKQNRHLGSFNLSSNPNLQYSFQQENGSRQDWSGDDRFKEVTENHESSRNDTKNIPEGSEKRDTPRQQLVPDATDSHRASPADASSPHAPPAQAAPVAALQPTMVAATFFDNTIGSELHSSPQLQLLRQTTSNVEPSPPPGTAGLPPLPEAPTAVAPNMLCPQSANEGGGRQGVAVSHGRAVTESDGPGSPAAAIGSKKADSSGVQIKNCMLGQKASRAAGSRKQKAGTGVITPLNPVAHRSGLKRAGIKRRLSIGNQYHCASEKDLEGNPRRKGFLRLRSNDDLTLTGENKPIQRISALKRGRYHQKSRASQDNRPLQVVMHLRADGNRCDIKREEREFLTKAINKRFAEGNDELSSLPGGAASGLHTARDNLHLVSRWQRQNKQGGRPHDDQHRGSHPSLPTTPPNLLPPSAIITAPHLASEVPSAVLPDTRGGRQQPLSVTVGQLEKKRLQRDDILGGFVGQLSKMRPGRNDMQGPLHEYQIVTDQHLFAMVAGTQGRRDPPLTSLRNSQKLSSKTRTSDRELKEQISQMAGSQYILQLPTDEHGNIVSPKHTDASLLEDQVDPSKENQKYQKLQIHGRTLIGGRQHGHAQYAQKLRHHIEATFPMAPSRVTIGEQVSLNQSSSGKFNIQGQRQAAALMPKGSQAGGNQPTTVKSANNRIYSVFRKSKDSGVAKAFVHPSNPELQTQRLQFRQTLQARKDESSSFAAKRGTTARSSRRKSMGKRGEQFSPRYLTANRIQSRYVVNNTKQPLTSNRDLLHLELELK